MNNQAREVYYGADRDERKTMPMKLFVSDNQEFQVCSGHDQYYPNETLDAPYNPNNPEDQHLFNNHQSIHNNHQQPHQNQHPHSVGYQAASNFTPVYTNPVYKRFTISADAVNMDTLKEDYIRKSEEAEELKFRINQMEKTMRWWSDCTAKWREKWAKTRQERNNTKDELKSIKSQLKKLQQQQISQQNTNKNNGNQYQFSCNSTSDNKVTASSSISNTDCSSYETNEDRNHKVKQQQSLPDNIISTNNNTRKQLTKRTSVTSSGWEEAFQMLQEENDNLSQALQNAQKEIIRLSNVQSDSQDNNDNNKNNKEAVKTSSKVAKQIQPIETKKPSPTKTSKIPVSRTISSENTEDKNNNHIIRSATNNDEKQIIDAPHSLNDDIHILSTDIDLEIPDNNNICINNIKNNDIEDIYKHNDTKMTPSKSQPINSAKESSHLDKCPSQNGSTSVSNNTKENVDDSNKLKTNNSNNNNLAFSHQRLHLLEVEMSELRNQIHSLTNNLSECRSQLEMEKAKNNMNKRISSTLDRRRPPSDSFK